MKLELDLNLTLRAPFKIQTGIGGSDALPRLLRSKTRTCRNQTMALEPELESGYYPFLQCLDHH